MSQAMTAEALNAFLEAEFPQVAGYRVAAVTAEGVTLTLTPTESHLRPGGTVSGPTMFALADLAVYAALLSRIGPEALAVTTSASLDFLRKPAAGAPLRATARLLKLGRRLAVADVLVWSGEGAEPVARATMTYAIPPKTGAEEAVPAR